MADFKKKPADPYHESSSEYHPPSNDWVNQFNQPQQFSSSNSVSDSESNNEEEELKDEASYHSSSIVSERMPKKVRKYHQ